MGCLLHSDITRRRIVPVPALKTVFPAAESAATCQRGGSRACFAYLVRPGFPTMAACGDDNAFIRAMLHTLDEKQQAQLDVARLLPALRTLVEGARETSCVDWLGRTALEMDEPMRCVL